MLLPGRVEANQLPNHPPSDGEGVMSMVHSGQEAVIPTEGPEKATHITTVRAALVAMAEGAPYEFNDEGFLVVGNPDHAPDQGTDPFIVVDVYALGSPPSEDGSCAPFGIVDATEDTLRDEDWFHDSDMGAR